MLKIFYFPKLVLGFWEFQKREEFVSYILNRITWWSNVFWGEFWDYIQSTALEPHNICSPIFCSYFICFHITTTKICAFSFCCSKGQRQPTFLNLNFQIIIAFCLLGVTFFFPPLLPTGWLVEGNKERRLHTGEATDIIGKWSSRQMRYCMGKHKMSFHAGLCQCHSALPEWITLSWFIFHSSSQCLVSFQLWWIRPC